ncbi:type II toxin-antitoxin system VapC family toxin [Pseudoxanthobacter sp. M-2]|uniref:PIN domain-containing protein n=1 Tax=Pseudoxanthobacter sp. M-2 TaxID=3078754 RepID=UPI0038FC7A2A
MIAFDTNILLRIVLSDDERQSPVARALALKASPDEPVLISVVVLVEFVWTLIRQKKVPRDIVVAELETLLLRPDVLIESVDAVEVALGHFRSGKADFSDYLIAELGRTAGATTTYTFDTDARDAPGFTLLTA